MAKRGGIPPGMFTKSASSEEDSSQPTQAQIAHTEAMNKWWSESFTNSFMPNLQPVVDAVVKAENKKLNDIILRMNFELAQLHRDIAVLSHVIAKGMTPDKYQKRLQEVHDELDISVKYKVTTYGPVDDTDDKNGDDDTPSVFTTVVKALTDDDADKPELVTRDTQPEPSKETKSWLRRLISNS